MPVVLSMVSRSPGLWTRSGVWVNGCISPSWETSSQPGSTTWRGQRLTSFMKSSQNSLKTESLTLHVYNTELSLSNLHYDQKNWVIKTKSCAANSLRYARKFSHEGRPSQKMPRNGIWGSLIFTKVPQINSLNWQEEEWGAGEGLSLTRARQSHVGTGDLKKQTTKEKYR